MYVSEISDLATFFFGELTPQIPATFFLWQRFLIGSNPRFEREAVLTYRWTLGFVRPFFLVQRVSVPG